MKPQLQQILHPPLNPFLSPAFASWFWRTYHVDPTGLIAHFDMTRGRGGDVQTWPDRENGNDIEQAAAGNQASIITAAGKLCRHFDGSDFIPQAVIASYTGLTPADNRSSFAPGSCWVAWDGIDLSPYADADYEVILEDSAGKRAKATMTATLGGGETWGPEIAPTSCCTDAADDQDNTTGWTGSSSILTSQADGHDGRCLLVARIEGSYPGALKSFSSTEGKFLRMTGRAKQKEEATVYMGISNDGSAGNTICSETWEAPADWDTSKTMYGNVGADTDLYVGCWVETSNATDGAYFDVIGVNELTDCATTGVYTGTWVVVETGFDYNDVTSITIRKSAFSVTGDLTIIVGFKPDDGQPAADEVIIAKMDETNSFMGYGITLDTAGKLVVTASNDGAVNDNFITNAAVYANGAQAAYSLIGFTYDASASNIDIFVSGVEVASTEQNDVSTAVYDTAVPFEIGRSADGNYFTGDMAVVFIFDRVLTAAEHANFARAFNLYG